MKFIRNIAALLLAFALAACEEKTPAPPAVQSLVAEPTEAQPRLPTTVLFVGPPAILKGATTPVARANLSLDPDVKTITAEICSTFRQIQTGMMFRTNMLDSEGMLFVFPQPRQAGFWMKNCPLPLSCAYIDPQGVILELHDMEPHNTNSIIANTDQVMFVLETSRGWFERNGIRTNMVIETERGTLLQTFFK